MHRLSTGRPGALPGLEGPALRPAGGIAVLSLTVLRTRVYNVVSSIAFVASAAASGTYHVGAPNNRETHVPAAQPPAKADARLSRADGHPERPPRAREPTPQGAQTPHAGLDRISTHSAMRTFDSLRGRREFTLVIRRGTPAARDALTVYGFAPRGAATTKIGVVIPKTVGKAVHRNRLRRRCKAILERAELRAPHRWYVISCRPGAAGLTFEELKRHLTSALAGAAGSMARPARRRA